MNDLVNWFAASAILIGALVSIVRPDNAFCPIALSPQSRVIAALVLGAIQTALQSTVGGTPALQAFGTALLAVVTALAAHGFRSPTVSLKAVPEGVVAQRGAVHVGLMMQIAAGCVLAVGALQACSWWNGGGNTKVTNAAVCIETDAFKGETVAQIAEDCGIDVAQVLVSLATSADAKVQQTPAAKEARAARAAMLAVDGGR